MKNFIEWYLGIPEGEPGEGTAWSLVTVRPWPSWLPLWLVLLIVVSIVAAVVLVYRRDASRLSGFRQAALISIRLFLLGLLAAILFQLSVVIERTGLPFVAVMIDTSASMGLDDDYSKRDASAIAASGQKSDQPVRLDIARSILNGNDGQFVRQLLQNHKVRLYRFSESAEMIGQSIDVDSIGALQSEIEKLQPTGLVTRPGPAVSKVLDDFRGSPPLAVIVVTDGIATGDDADRLSDTAANRSPQVPLFIAAMGSQQPNKDLQLFDVQMDEIAVVNDPVIISGKVKSFGFADRQATIQLIDQESDAVLKTETVDLPKDGQATPIEFTWTPDSEGEFDLKIELVAQAGERNPNNNSENRRISVRGGRMKVLYVESKPRFEFRYIKTFFERQVQETNTIELNTILLESDPEYAAQDVSAQTLAGRFPISRDELFAYDVVIFGDVDPRFLGRRSLDNLRDFVGEHGGGLILIAGPDHNPVSYRGTSLETLFPIDVSAATLPTDDEEFEPQLTIPGRKATPVFRFENDEVGSLQAWSEFPKLRWIVEAPALSPGAVVLVAHPGKSADHGQLPVIVQHQFGAGKVVFHATDELWLWRLRTGDRYFGRYWLQQIRFLSRSNLLGRDRAAELTTDRLIYQPAEPIVARVRFLDSRLIPANDDPVSITLERRDGFQKQVTLEKTPDATGIFEVRIPGMPIGSYHAWVDRPSFERQAPTADFRVELPTRELRKRSLAADDLMKAAKTSRGGYYTPATAMKIPADLPTGRMVTIERRDPLPLWNRWEVLLLFVLLLSTEWIFRKRFRLV